MSLENEEVVEEVVATTETTETVSEPETTTEEVAEPEATTEEVTEPEAYSPDYSFKAYGEEKKFDDFLQASVTNKEQEDQLRSLYAKAYGLDPMKEKYETVRGEHTELSQKVESHYQPMESQHNETVKGLQRFDHMIQNKDYSSFFDGLKINKQDVVQWAAQELQYQEMSPQEQMAIDQQRQASNNNYSLNEQNQQYQTQINNMAVSNRETQLNLELSRPEVSEFVKHYDERVGKPGAFREQVVNQGALAWHQKQTDVPANELVSGMMEQWSWVKPNTQTQVTSATTVTAPTDKPVLANVQGSSNRTPTKRVVNSMADINAIIKEKAAMEANL